MHTLYFLFICCFLVCAVSSSSSYYEFASRQTIDLKLHLYCDVGIGADGALITLIIDRNSDHIYISKSLIDNTDYIVAATGPTPVLEMDQHESEEIIYIASTHLRLPVRWVSSIPVSIASGIPVAGRVVGVLGLGEGSPLWSHWRGYTLSPWTLVLRARNQYWMTNIHTGCLNSTIGEHPVMKLGARNCSVSLNPYSPIMRIPHDFRGAPLVDAGMCHHHGIPDFIPTKSMLGAPGPPQIYMAYHDEDVIEMGYWACRHFQIDLDYVSRKWTFSPASYFTQGVDYDAWFSVVSAAAMAFTACAWILGTLSFGRIMGDPFAFMIIMCFKLYGSSWAIAFLALNPRAHGSENAVRWYTHEMNPGAYDFVMVIALAALIIDAAISFVSMCIWWSYYHKKNGRGGGEEDCTALLLANKLFYEPGILLAIWLAFMMDCRNRGYASRPIIISAVIICTSLFNFMSAICRYRPLAPVGLLAFVGSVLFAYYFNVAIFMHHYHSNSQKEEQRAGAMALILILALCVIVASRLLSYQRDAICTGILLAKEKKIGSGPIYESSRAHNER